MVRHAVSAETNRAVCGAGRPYRFPAGHTYVYEGDDLEAHPITCPGCKEALRWRTAIRKAVAGDLTLCGRLVDTYRHHDGLNYRQVYEVYLEVCPDLELAEFDQLLARVDEAEVTSGGR